MDLDDLLNLLFAPIFAILWWVASKVSDHGERLTKVETVAVGTEKIREIVGSETEKVHKDMERMEGKIDEMRKAMGTRKSDK